MSSHERGTGILRCHCQIQGVSVTQDFLEVSDDPFLLLDRGKYCLGVSFGKNCFFEQKFNIFYCIAANVLFIQF